MKKILITGAAGFIGSHLTEECVRRGFPVKAFVHYNSSNSRGWLEHSTYAKDIEFFTGDIRDYDSVFAAVKGCESVLHLAALIGIPYSYITPLAYIRTNVEGTYNVLQSARELNVSNVLVTSTSETYGTAQYTPIDEKHPAVGQSPYAASKIAADQLALSYHRSFGLPVKIARPFNTYGPRQSARAIIPTIISQVLGSQKEINLGNTTPMRDFTYVADTVAGILAIAASPELAGQATNIGVNTKITIGDLVNIIGELTQTSKEIITQKERVRPVKSEVFDLICNNTALKRATGWAPRYDLRKGLEETIDFMRHHLTEYKAEIYNV